ncbi:MAG TPA: aminopeptidase P N-terminal domain-containing protein [Candidatus Mcinerneyibacteriales bacterium]|nr:aminopeptidase P N-terminal domain-containing protein [Candidatus Mcinerneyibacteriales bacterium]HPE20093.1 aminopeptidase P N-terminal domain-containing protein [Candidatus Mcinerneyibacteriales bacterium]HPJ69771.1 aminopeptidase P N-terminal domain-containing protein [Candidatus Mcinerneyibacteriales bacterium]
MARNIFLTQDELKKRRHHFARTFLGDRDLLLLFAGSEQRLRNGLDNVYPFRQDSNFYYLTGIKESEAIFILTKTEKGEIREILFVQEKDPLKEKWTGYRLGKEAAKEISGISDVYYLNQSEGIISQLFNRSQRVWIPYPYKGTLNEETSQEVLRINRFKEGFPHLRFLNALDLLKVMRTRKSPLEIKFLKEAVKITKTALHKTWKKMKPGMTEYQIRALVEYEFKRQGGDIAFNSIVAAGENGVVLHYVECDKVVEEGELVLFDVGAEYGLYSADITRTVPISGRFTPEQLKYYNMVLECNKKVIDAACQGTTLGELNSIVVETLQKRLIEDGLISQPEEIGKYYYHGVSHHLGLDTHDLGQAREAGLPVNSVITVEPGLYIKEKKMGIRIEDDIVIKRNQALNLSKSIAKEPEELMGIMKK